MPVMTADDFRSLAIALPGVIEATHQGHADFRVRGKIFATLGYPDDEWGMVRLAPDEQAKRMKQAPTVFVPAKGSWGEQGSTLVKLQAATAETARPAMRAAWERLVREETVAQGQLRAGKRTERPKRKKI
jgi:hypothetical protein